MKMILMALFLGLITNVAMAQDQQSSPQPTTFMGNQLGETVQQWLSLSDQPKKCSPFSTAWDRKSIPTIRFCTTVKNIAGGGAGQLDTKHPGGGSLAKDHWYFQNGKLAALIGTFLPYDKTLAELREKYGTETKKQAKLVVHVLSPTYPVFGEKWAMPDGTLIFLAEDTHAVNHANLVVSTQAYINQQQEANNPF